MPVPELHDSEKKGNTRNLVIAALVGQVGVLTLVIILAAVFGGLALDARFDTKPWFTVGLLVASIPISLFTMIFLVRKAVAKIKVDSLQKYPGKEEGIGKDA
jgi:F0F1-type ATP synthase assembly protein I